MASTSETGHAKNVANLLKLNQLIATFGTTYNPSNNTIKPASLTALYTTATAKLTATNTAFTNWKNATNARELAFTPLTKQATQILGTLQSLGIVQQTIDDFAFQVNKFRSSTTKTPATAPNTTAPTAKIITPLPPIVVTEPIQAHNSTSQQSFDNKLQHLEKMILILQSIPTYTPNETPYKIATLQTQLTTLITLNNTANTSYATLKSARIDRNTIFYNTLTGMLSVVKLTKAYIRSIYGSTSPQYHAITALKFVKVIRK